MTDDNKKSLTSAVLVGASWAIAMRWSIKIVGLVSSAILARLLMPEDYGLVAIAMIAVGLISVLFEMGVETSLIQRAAPTTAHFNTAWTIRLIQAVIIASGMLILAPLSADFYGDVRLPEIVQIVALSVFVKGFENIGIIKFRKDLELDKDFRFFVINKIIGAVLTVLAALYFRSYYALVFGLLMQSTISVVHSYIASGYRPRLSLSAFGDVWNFSKWIIVKNFSDFIGKQGGAIFLSKLAPAPVLGFYRWGTELSSMSTSEVVFPLLRSLMPGMVKVKEDRQRLTDAFLLSTGMIATLVVPLAMGFSGVAAEFIPLFLGGGDKWIAVVPLAQILAFAALSNSFYQVAASMLIVIGHIRLTAFVSWFRAILVVLSMYPVFQLYGVVGIAAAQAMTGLAALFVIYTVLSVKVEIAPSRLLSALWRQLLAGAVMAAILLLSFSDSGGTPALILILKIPIGMICYLGMLYLLWMLSGRPESGEKKVFMLVWSKVSRSSRRR
ncbi:MAG: oligosaccharide flippase family protein [Candidatus Competibacteraceae bacterium]|jgi:O-antigen/teichoic acid export membrane protein|nr:oligosaccharide flippase family protein [Candidatus Competibacteraceae bacterium]